MNEQQGRRIVNGKNVVPPHSHPWMVTVTRNKHGHDSESSFGCGGTLISRKHILSADHCARRCDSEATSMSECKDKSINWAILGDHDKRKPDGELFVPITKPYHHHPNANQKTKPNGAYEYDYVIFVLSCCVTFNDFIQPICLPNKPISSIAGENVTVLGWGHTKYKGETTPILKEVEIEIIDDESCLVYEPQRSSVKYDNDFLMCAGDRKNWDKDACQDDSGGKFFL